MIGMGLLDGMLGLRPFGAALAGAGGAAFSPLDLSPVFWLDADEIATLYQDSGKTTSVTADGQNVGAWVDRALETTEATQATATKFPLYKTGIRNGKPGILFDGVNDFLTLPDLALDGAVTVLMVLTTVDNNAYAVPIVLSRNTSNVYYLWMATNTSANQVVGSVFDTAERNVSISGDPTGGNIYAMTNVEGAPISVWRNGIETAGVVNLGTYGSQGASRLGIWRDSVNYPYNGYVHEVLVYGRVLDDAEMIELNSYLGQKWGIATVQESVGNPAGVTGASFWFDASRLTAVEDAPINVLSDLSASGNHAAQPVLANQGLYKTNIQNSLPAVLMDGTNDFYRMIADIVAETGMSVFGVYKIVNHAPASDPMLVAITNNDAEPFVMELFYSVPAALDRFQAVGYDSTDSAIDAIVSSTPIGAHVFGGVEAEGGTINAYLDDAVTVGDAVTAFGCPYTGNNAVIGSNTDGLSRWMNGYICEVAGWNRALNSGEIAAVIAYLSAKWGTTP